MNTVFPKRRLHRSIIYELDPSANPPATHSTFINERHFLALEQCARHPLCRSSRCSLCRSSRRIARHRPWQAQPFPAALPSSALLFFVVFLSYCKTEQRLCSPASRRARPRRHSAVRRCRHPRCEVALRRLVAQSALWRAGQRRARLSLATARACAAFGGVRCWKEQHGDARTATECCVVG